MSVRKDYYSKGVAKRSKPSLTQLRKEKAEIDRLEQMLIESTRQINLGPVREARELKDRQAELERRNLSLIKSREEFKLSREERDRLVKQGVFSEYELLEIDNRKSPRPTGKNLSRLEAKELSKTRKLEVAGTGGLSLVDLMTGMAIIGALSVPFGLISSAVNEAYSAAEAYRQLALDTEEWIIANPGESVPDTFILDEAKETSLTSILTPEAFDRLEGIDVRIVQLDEPGEFAIASEATVVYDSTDEEDVQNLIDNLDNLN